MYRFPLTAPLDHAQPRGRRAELFPDRLVVSTPHEEDVSMDADPVGTALDLAALRNLACSLRALALDGWQVDEVRAAGDDTFCVMVRRR